MDNLIYKHLKDKNMKLEILITLSEFEALAIDVIREDTGIDLTGYLKCDYDEQSYAIETIISERLDEDKIDELGKYSINEWYETTEHVLFSLFGPKPGEQVYIYTNPNSASSVDDKSELPCYIGADINLFSKYINNK